MAHVALGGEFPVATSDDKEPLFKVKLMGGDDDSLVIKVTPPKILRRSSGLDVAQDGPSSLITLVRGKDPTPCKVNGKTYLILYRETYVGLDQPAETPLAMITVTYSPETAEKDLNAAPVPLTQAEIDNAKFSKVVSFEQGARRFSKGDDITILEVM